MPKILFFTVMGVLALAGCTKKPTTSPSSSEKEHKATSVFRGAFGEEFQYSSPITIDHNPHGGADRALFNWQKSPIGGLVHIPLPPAGGDLFLVDIITKDIKKKTGANTVAHTQFENPSGCHFERFQTTASREGRQFEYCLFLFLDTRPHTNQAQEILRQTFGGYKFEFIVPKEDYETVRPYIEEAITSFKRPVDRGP